MATILIRRHELEQFRYPKRAVTGWLWPQKYEIMMEATLKQGSFWEVVFPKGEEVHFPREHVHEVVTIHIDQEKLRRDPSFPPDHPIWGLPIYQRETISGHLIPELEAAAVEFYGYFRITLQGTITCFVHEDQAAIQG
jgi:hypothetical protein